MATTELFLGDISILPRLKPKKVNLIYAPVGSGKSTWVKDDVIQSVSDKREILYLTDTTAGRDQALKDDEPTGDLTTYSMEWHLAMNRSKIPAFGQWTMFPPDKVPIMTYSKIAHLIKRSNGYFGFGYLKYIILDECQNLKIFQSYSDDDTLKYCEKWLIKALRETDIILVVLSATPKKVYSMFYHNQIVEILTDIERQSLRTLKNGEIKEYASMDNLLLSPPAGRTVVYTSHISQMKLYAETIKANDTRNVEMIWSRNNEKYPLSNRQLYIWDSILQNATIPYDIDILIYNASCLTGVNIRTPVDNVIIDDWDEDNQIQARGRIRSDINTLYIPSKSPNYLYIPSDFIGIPIFSDRSINKLTNNMPFNTKNGLINCINCRIDGHLKRWTSIRKFIEDSDDYCFKVNRNGNPALRYQASGSDLTYHLIQYKG